VCEDGAGPGVRINRAGFATQGLPGTCDMALVHWSPLASRLLKPASSSIICHSSKRSHMPCRRRLVRPRRGGHSAWGRAEQGKGSEFKASTRDVRIRSVDSPSIWRTLKNPRVSYIINSCLHGCCACQSLELCTCVGPDQIVHFPWSASQAANICINTE